MNVELINCEVCGHIVATDAACCPQCNSRAYKVKWMAQINQYEQESARKHKQYVYNKIRDELRSLGKLYQSAGIESHYMPNTLSNDIELHTPYLTNPEFFNMSDYRISDKECLIFSIDDEVIHYQRFDFGTPLGANNYVILPYGKHKLSVSVVKHRRTYVDSMSKTPYDYNTLRKHELHTYYFNVDNNDNSLVRACATFRKDKPSFFSSHYNKLTFVGFTVKEFPLNLDTVNQDDLKFICSLLGKDISFYESSFRNASES